jgi:predicted permease
MPSLRVTLRGLAHTPLFTIVGVLSLALGIGANTAIFSLLDQILLRKLPVKNPEELVFLYSPGQVQGSVSSDEPDGPSFTYPVFRELQKAPGPFAGLAGARNRSVSLAYNRQASHGTARLVSGNYFDVLGVRAASGRLFTEADDRNPGGHPLAILDHGYWTSRFGNDPGVLNQTLIVNGYPMTIIGVAQKGFTSERMGSPPDLYVPISMWKEITPEAGSLEDRRNYWVTLLARLKPGVTQAQAEAAINVPYHAQVEQDVQLLRQPNPNFLQRFRARKIILKPGQNGRGNLRDEGRQPIYLLMGITAMVLLIACANVANLQLARSAARTREVAIRLSMGASRLRLIQQLLGESCVVAVAGGVLGLFAAKWTLRAIIVSIPPATGVPGSLSADLDGRVLLFSLALSIATGLLFGLFPALQASRPNVVSELKNQTGQLSSSGSANVFRKTLVTAQMGIALLLLISAGLLAETLVNLERINLGIRVDHLMSFSLLPKLNRYTDQSVANFYEQLTDRLAAIPGVQMVSAARMPAIAGSSSGTNITVEGFTPTTEDSAQSNFNIIGAGFFRTLGTPVLLGREFTRSDNAAAPKVAMVNEAFVKRFLPNQNPIGRHIGQGTSKPEIQIVGVVKDAKYADMREPPPAVFYTPLPQTTRWNTLFFYLRTAVDPEQTAMSIRREVAVLDANLPIRELKTMQAQIDENMFVERILSTLTGIFAGLATVLAAIGLYGVLAFNVMRRTREIGIRMALGAGAGQVRRLVLREVGMMLAIGTVAGVTLAVVAGKFLQTFLFGMKASDPIVIAAAAALLWAIAVAAAYLPARKATRVDPMVALRYE